MEIHYAGKISKNDFLKALLLNNSQLNSRKWMTGTILLFFVFAIIFLQLQSPSILAEKAEIFSSLYPGMLIGLVFMTYPWWTPYLQSMSYNQKGNIYRDNVYGLINETQVTINGTNIQAVFQWNGYIDYKVAKDMLLIYQGKNNFNVFTKSMFSNQDEWEKLLSLAKDKVALNKKRA
jgi:hypothetical protein